MQPRLFEIEDTASPIPENGHSNPSDPSFAVNKTLPVHRWVPWIAGFSSQFVRQSVRTHLQDRGVVLDPFAGVGTTLVEAMLLGHQAIGFEINPYAALACRVKTRAPRISVEKLQCEIERLQDFYSTRISNGYRPHSSAPPGFKTRSAFYSPAVLRKVLILHDFMTTITDPDLRDLFRLAFASTMVRYSNYSYEPSLGRRASAGKADILDFPVGQTVIAKLDDMVQDIIWFRANLPQKTPEAQLFNVSFFEYANYLSPASVDVLITSPPYLNNYHYNRNTRPQLYWLGFVKHPRDLVPLEQSNFGKFWQTVRGKKQIALNFSLPGSDLPEQLQRLRNRNPDRGVYGGSGWANYAASYFNDCYLFAQAIKQLLKPSGMAIVVIGNSILQGVMIPTDRYFGQIAESVGLELVGIDVPRMARVGNSIIRSQVRVKARKSHRLYEAVIKLRNPLTPGA